MFAWRNINWKPRTGAEDASQPDLSPSIAGDSTLYSNPSGPTDELFGQSSSFSYTVIDAVDNTAYSTATLAINASSLAPQTVTYPGSGFVFNNTYGSGVSVTFRNEIVAAENYLQSLFGNACTVNCNFDVQSINPQFSGGNSYLPTHVSYSSFIAALQQHATTAPALAAAASLASLSDPSHGAGFDVSVGEARILGLAGAASGTDDNIVLNSLYWTASALQSDPDDAEAVLEHELSEGIMGRVGALGLDPNFGSSWAPMDLFRFTASGQRDFTGGADGQLTYFSVDGSNVYTGLQFHNSLSSGQFDNYDLADWDQVGADSNAQDPFGPGGPGTGDPGTLSSTDITILEALGWSSGAPPSVAVHSFEASPNQSVAISPLYISLLNPSNHSITSYWVEDLGGAYGHLSVGGAAEPDGQWVQATSNWSNVQYVGGASAGGDTLEARIYDSTTGSFIYSPTFTATTTMTNVITVSPPSTILQFTGSGFNATRVFSPTVVTVGNEYVMLYAGLPFANNIQIGLATSSDGVNWTNNSSNPVISNASSQSWASFREIPVSLLYENGTYELWFNGDNSNLNTDPGYGSGFGYATSSDGIHWMMDAADPIRWELNSPNGTGFDLIGVIKFNGRYEAYYLNNTPNASVLESAVSTDRVDFTGDTPVNAPSGDSLQAITTTTVNGTQEIYSIWQDGSGQDYYAISTDGLNFTVEGTVNSPSSFGINDIQIANGQIQFFGTSSVGDDNWAYGNTVIQFAQAPQTTPPPPPPPPNPPPPPAPNYFYEDGTSDFTGDGMSDILLRNANGTVFDWLMNGTQIAGGGTIAVPDNSWQIAATADFTGDGKSDILWRNENGTVLEWLMNGTQIVGGGTVAAPDNSWQIAGVGDFNGDGKSDILWRNDNGSVLEWLMNGTQIAGGGAVTTGGTPRPTIPGTSSAPAIFSATAILTSCGAATTGSSSNG